MLCLQEPTEWIFLTPLCCVLVDLIGKSLLGYLILRFFVVVVGGGGGGGGGGDGGGGGGLFIFKTNALNIYIYIYIYI